MISLLASYQLSHFLKTIKFPFIPDFKNCIAPHQSSNFWVVPIVNLLDFCEFNLIINSSYWYLALITRESSWMNHEYIDFPLELTRQLELGRKEVQLLTKQILELRLDRSELSELGKSELEQIKYWKCNTVGDVIFNGFD